MAKLTADNYDVLKLEHMALPIRQSTEEEITEVVETMYSKAVRPEDAPYVELYARLMSELVVVTGPDGVGKTIRKAIVDRCQKQFEQPFSLDDKDQVDDQGRRLDEEAINVKRKMLKDKLRANIQFLGHLFCCGMVKEAVVNLVLWQLLFGTPPATAAGSSTTTERQKRRKPEDYEFEMFCDLLKKVATSLSSKILTQYIPTYMTSIKELIEKRSVTKRIEFLLMDIVELHDNNWVPVRKGGGHGTTASAPKVADHHRQQEEEAAARTREVDQMIRHGPGRGGVGGGIIRTGGTVRVGGTAVAPTQVLARKPDEPAPLDIELVQRTFERFCSEGVSSEVERLFAGLTQSHRLEALKLWLYRTITVMKLREERRKTGDLLTVIIRGNFVTDRDVSRIVSSIAKELVENDLFEDSPKLFACWAEVINHGHAFLSPELHTDLLQCMTNNEDPHRYLKAIVSCIKDICQQSQLSDVWNPSGMSFPRRFRILPKLLMSVLPLKSQAERDEENPDGDDEQDDRDLLAIVLEEISREGWLGRTMDLDLHVFDLLCQPANKGEMLTSTYKTNPHRADYVVIANFASAIFSYTRCDEAPQYHEIERCSQLLFQLVRGGDKGDYTLLVLAEAYATWRDLEYMPRNAFRAFVEGITRFRGVSMESMRNHLAKLREMIRINYPQDAHYDIGESPAAAAAAPAPSDGRAGGGRGGGR